MVQPQASSVGTWTILDARSHFRGSNLGGAILTWALCWRFAEWGVPVFLGFGLLHPWDLSQQSSWTNTSHEHSGFSCFVGLVNPANGPWQLQGTGEEIPFWQGKRGISTADLPTTPGSFKSCQKHSKAKITIFDLGISAFKSGAKTVAVAFTRQRIPNSSAAREGVLSPRGDSRR